jgi:MoaA/NifB/PqqE/SkfB family radical SAM enzyme
MNVAAPADPTRYFESVSRNGEHASPPVCLYLEVTNRCNLLCETCPRTFEELEPPTDMSWDLFTRIVDQARGVTRAVLHGVGEPMLVRDLPRMIAYLKDRGIYVLFNTNGTLLREKRFRELIEAGLDELRVSLDAATAALYAQVRGRPFFDRIVRDVRNLREFQDRENVQHPRVSLWLTGLKETIQQLPDFVRLAARMRVYDVHLQRLVYDEAGFGLARRDSSLFEQANDAEIAAIEAAQAIGRELGVKLDASGASEPELSLRRQGEMPWSGCRRPWSLMYFTAHGRALPCCIAPFSARGYETYTLGNAAAQSLEDIWEGQAYRDFRTSLMSDAPPKPCRNCGLRWSL